ncbi:RNA-binding domain-containing protein [Microbacterium sp. X-17]|uniref:RNA-binding domain-containing protein n=1 Tax=Microbacterium sp. X-17 TaxID=3144404 RepID=UPI0031F5186C
MNADEAAALIAGRETLTVEFKRARRKDLSDEEIVEAAACLANAEGGVLFLGVTNDGQIEGLHPRHGAVTEPHLLRAMLMNRTEPPLDANVELLKLDGVEIAAITIPRSVFPVGTTGGKYLRRTLQPNGEPQCKPLMLHAMLAQGLAAQGSDYAGLAARGVSLEDLDPLEFERFRRLCAVGKGDRALADASADEILRALRLIRPEEPTQVTLGASLLFGARSTIERSVPTHEVLFQEFRAGEVTFSETMRGPLIATAERLTDLLQARNNEQELMLGIHRVGIPRIPGEVIRESIANALTHRDYAALGPVVVQLDEQQLRVTSPGGLPHGVTLTNLLDTSVPRSPILVDAFKRAGIVDRAGRGIREMYAFLLRAGRGEPDYTQTTADHVVVRIPTADSDLELVRFLVEFEDQNRVVFSLPALRILHDLKEAGPQSPSELADALGSTASVLRGELTRLAGWGVVEVAGSGRSRQYGLTASFYRLAESDAYARLKGMDPLQQEQLILRYVGEFGSITRSQAASLCHLSSVQASHLLQRMRNRGALELHGEKRGARYLLPKG